MKQTVFPHSTIDALRPPRGPSIFVFIKGSLANAESLFNKKNTLNPNPYPQMWMKGSCSVPYQTGTRQ
jgi:hypothetical protein